MTIELSRFNLELGEGLAESYANGLDQNAYDAVCEHLLVEEKATEAARATQAEVELLRSTACRETVYEAVLTHARG